VKLPNLSLLSLALAGISGIFTSVFERLRRLQIVSRC